MHSLPFYCDTQYLGKNTAYLETSDTLIDGGASWEILQGL